MLQRQKRRQTRARADFSFAARRGKADISNYKKWIRVRMCYSRIFLRLYKRRPRHAAPTGTAGTADRAGARTVPESLLSQHTPRPARNVTNKFQTMCRYTAEVRTCASLAHLPQGEDGGAAHAQAERRLAL